MKTSFQTSLIHFIGVGICGFGIKKCNHELIFTTSILIYSLLHFVLGLIIYSNPIAPNKLTLVYEKSSILLTTSLYAPFINAQQLSQADYWHLRNVIVITSLLLALLQVTGKCWKLFLDIFIATQCALLMYLGVAYDDNDDFWLPSLAFLIAFNYFAVPALTRRYSVPKHELLSISVIFQNLFLINSLH